MRTRCLVHLALCVLSLVAWSSVSAGEGSGRADRPTAVKALCGRLGVGPGASVADVGCGSGEDSMVLAEVVGETGAVFSEEIKVESLTGVVQRSREKGLTQVVPVLGESTDPRLPNGRLDLIYIARLGVREYYIFDPEGESIEPPFRGFRLDGGTLREIPPLRVEGAKRVFSSDELGLELHGLVPTLRWVDPAAGAPLPVTSELGERLEAETDRAERAEAQARRAAARAEREAARAKRAQAELARLREELSRRPRGPENR